MTFLGLADDIQFILSIVYHEWPIYSPCNLIWIHSLLHTLHALVYRFMLILQYNNQVLHNLIWQGQLLQDPAISCSTAFKLKLKIQDPLWQLLSVYLSKIEKSTNIFSLPHFTTGWKCALLVHKHHCWYLIVLFWHKCTM